MKIGVMSDSHENMPMIARAVEYFNASGAEIVLHAGDIISPMTFKEFKALKCKLVAVFGNNDGETRMLVEKFNPIGRIRKSPYELELSNSRILLLHEPDGLEQAAMSGRYDVIIYGHTHKPDIRDLGAAKIINPGETGGWLTGKSTVAMLELPSRKVELKEL